MQGRIDARKLKQEACRYKREKIPSEEFGEMLIGLVDQVSSHHYKEPGFPVDRDETRSLALLRCIEATESVKCSSRPDRIMNFYKTVAFNLFRRVYRDHYREKNAWARYARDTT